MTYDSLRTKVYVVPHGMACLAVVRIFPADRPNHTRSVLLSPEFEPCQQHCIHPVLVLLQ